MTITNTYCNIDYGNQNTKHIASRLQFLRLQYIVPNGKGVVYVVYTFIVYWHIALSATVSLNDSDPSLMMLVMHNVGFKPFFHLMIALDLVSIVIDLLVSNFVRHVIILHVPPPYLLLIVLPLIPQSIYTL